MNEKEKLFNEDFSYTINRINSFESRYYQMLIFFISAFGVVLSFSKEIPNELIPLILFSLLWVSCLVSMNSRILQARESAYLLKKYYSQNENINHESFYKYCSEIRQNKTKRFKYLKRLISNPYFVFLTITVIFSYYFGHGIIKSIFCTNKILVILYLAYIAWSIYKVFDQMIEFIVYDYRYYQELYDKFEYNKKNSTT